MGKALAEKVISIHALLAESDGGVTGGGSQVRNHFYPRSPCGERLNKRCKFNGDNRISIHALLAESDIASSILLLSLFISIHALLAESDVHIAEHASPGGISIHALLAESDQCGSVLVCQPEIFLSTLSLRRATKAPLWTATATEFLSTLSLRRATLPTVRCVLGRTFLSTLSLRRATQTVKDDKGRVSISIHALLAESDMYRDRIPSKWSYFYPRSPCGERPANLIVLSKLPTFLSTLSLRRATPDIHQHDAVCLFLSTLSLRRATRFRRWPIPRNRISIHALLAESDQKRPKHQTQTQHFYPRSPCGERRW